MDQDAKDRDEEYKHEKDKDEDNKNKEMDGKGMGEKVNDDYKEDRGEIHFKYMKGMWTCDQ